nr:histidine kinase [Cellulomonas sp. APG4]
MRDVQHLLVGVLADVAGLLVLALLVVAAVLAVAPSGRRVLVRAIGLQRRLADHQRLRTQPPVSSPYLPSRGDADVRTLLRDQATWRDLVWLVLPTQTWLALLTVLLTLTALQGLLLPVIHLIAPDSGVVYNGVPVTGLGVSLLGVPIGVGVGVLAALAPQAFLDVEARFTQALLGPTTARRLAGEVARLAETRSEAVDSSAAELRRIERDLHDGAQARLVAVTLHLGMAEELLDTDPAAARGLVREARSAAHDAIADLRALVRGIHPPLLADRGVGDALEALALASPVPVELDVRLGRRLPAPVESAAYFTAAELLTNAVKHAGAARIVASLHDTGDALVLRVHDDGRGGADPALGTGLRGIARRIEAFDGALELTSPAGGPTTVEAVLPCAS